MFDLPQDTTGLPIKPENITEIQAKYDVQISIRLKAKQNTKACIIKGTEKWACKLIHYLYEGYFEVIEIQANCLN